MNEATIIGAGLCCLGLAYLAVFILLYLLDFPFVAKLWLVVMTLGSAVSGFGCGLAIIQGGTGPFGFTASTWAIGFLLAQLVGLVGFELAMILFFGRRGEG